MNRTFRGTVRENGSGLRGIAHRIDSSHQPGAATLRVDAVGAAPAPNPRLSKGFLFL